MPGAGVYANKSGIKREIATSFRLHGYTLRLEASRHLEDLLGAFGSSEARRKWIDKILETLEHKDLDSNVLDRPGLDKIIQECSHAESGDTADNVFNIIDAFDVPRLTYSVDRKKFLPDSIIGRAEPRVYAGAEAKADVYKARYLALHQRTARHKLFTPSAASGCASSSNDQVEKTRQLKSVDFLLGTNAKLTDVIVLGMLTQLKHGRYSLEDPTGTVDLDLTETKFHTGLYTENCFVLLEGWYEDRLFHVVAMGHPPIESSATSRAYFGSVNFFGGPLEVAPKAITSDNKLLTVEQTNESAMFVFLSDVWLDRPLVMSKLRKLFQGYSAMPPTAIILMGNFMAAPDNSSQHAKILKDLFRQLGEMIADYPELVSETKFIFVPGPTDPGFANIFPRPSLPEFITEDLLSKVPSSHFVSNPCRLQYCTQEIVLFREDIVTKMCRNCVYFPEAGDIPSHFARTILAQGHLAPLPMHTCPVYWDYDRSMWLYPLPDLVICGDKFDPFTTETQNGCTVVNPGSFGKNDFSFKTYVPQTKLVEDSQIPDDDMQ